MPSNNNTNDDNKGNDSSKKRTKEQIVKDITKKVLKKLGPLVILILLVTIVYALYYYLQTPKTPAISKNPKDTTQQKKNFKKDKPKPENKPPLPKSPDTDPLKKAPKKQPRVPQKKGLPLEPKVQLSEELLAYRDAKIVEFEEDINSITRGSNTLEVMSPKLREGYDQLVFKITYKAQEKLYVTIYDSTMAHQVLKSKVIMQKQGDEYLLKMLNLKKGTYYWKLINDQRKIFSGKFYIKK